ncbi:MDR family MFS transporter [Levilactobacillus namurensis]|uniref:MDR family MFS transporter n=1 Tax=Levilactobacillus namurensis TaxID=380393 RepID=UPI0004636556|nr:MDR family MFS transporter [Levilactobacillus namurensis]
MTTQTRRRLVFAILLGGFLSSLTETILNNALPTIMRELQVDQSTSQWLSTGYILIVGVMMPTAAYFISRFRLRPLFLTTLALFLGGTVLAAVAPNFGWLLVGRLIQAISVGISMPLTQNVMTLVYPPEKRGTAMGMAAIVIILGPAIGPTLSGWIVDNYSWRMLFIALIPITVLVLVMSAFFVKNINQISAQRLDFPSLGLSTLGFGALLSGFSEIGASSRLNLVNGGLILVGVVVVGLFVWYQLSMTKPLLEMRVFKSASFTKTTVLAALTNIAMLGTELIVPLYLQKVRGTSAMAAGLMLLPGAITMAIMTPIAGRILDRYGIKRMAYTGFTVLTAATLPMLWFDQHTNLVWIMVLYAVRMTAIALVMMPVTTSGINALPNHLVFHGNTVCATFRQIASSLGTAGLVTIASVVSRGATTASALTTGYRAAFAAAMITSLICLLLTVTLQNRTQPEI